MLSWLTCCEIFKALIVLAYRLLCAHIRTITMILMVILFLFKYNVKFRKTVWFFFQQLLAIGVALVWCTIILPMLIFQQPKFANVLLLSQIAKPLAHMAGISYEIRNKENMVAEYESAVLISNHQSKWDALSMMYMINDMDLISTGVVAYNLSWLGPLAWVLQQCKFAFVRRDSGLQSTHKEINSLVDDVCKEKIKIWFFPEGLTSKTLLPFKKGAFRAAIDKKIPIIPVVFSPHDFIDWDDFKAEEGKIIIDILPPISTTEFTHENMGTLIEKTFAIVDRKYEELGEEIERERHEKSD